MADNQFITPEGYTVDTVTGFLQRVDGTSIQPKDLTAFLKAFKKSGDKTKSIEAQGFQYTDLEWWIINDTQFKHAFKNVLFAMKHELEGEMFKNAFKPSGHKERQTWLETNFPEEYGKNVKHKGVKNKSKLDTLMESL